MKRKVFSLMMGLLLAFTGIAKSDVLTVCDGSASSGRYPFYGLYHDAYTRSEVVYPASILSAMSGGSITQLTFYLSYTSSSQWNTTQKIYLREVPSNTISSFYTENGATLVYEGSLNPPTSTGAWTITLDTPYRYNGGNLLLGTSNTQIGSYSTREFYGTEAYPNTAVYGYAYNAVPTNCNTPTAFLPKTTFTYEPGDAPDLGLHVIAADGTIDRLDMGYRPVGAWMQPYRFTMTYDGNEPIAVSILDFTPNDGYFTMVDVEYPIAFRNGDEEEMAIATGDSDEDIVERQFVAIYEGTRLAKIWDITAQPYTPMCPDMVEVAHNVTSFPYIDYPDDRAWIHDNYALPHPEIEDGPDAVYKVTFEEDALLNADVIFAENGKIAVYTEDFYEEQFGIPGPDVQNNYTGPQIVGGGSGSAPYDVVIGTGTSTSSYQPYYTLYENSLSQQLYQASILQEAGMGAGVINTIGYYTGNSYAYPVGAIKIWMANVTDSNVPSNSVLGSNMTLVYDAASNNAVVGWNDFELNGAFSWDGTSNLLVLFQRTNNEWHGGPSWQYTSQSYYAGAYDYDDDITYNAQSTSYPLETSLLLPNTHFVGGGRELADRASARYPIRNMTMVPGTYYIVASSTLEHWGIEIDATELPCPEQAFAPTPADDEDGLEPASVQLSWQLGDYTTEYRLVFGSTYYCEDVLVDWTTDLSQIYTVNNLYNNTNYFWRVDERNHECETLGEVWGFTTHLNVPQNLRVADETIFEGESVVLSWNAIQDRTYRYYYIYQDGEKIGETTVNQVGETTYTVTGLEYNMEGYVFNVTAVYDEGESAFSNDVNVKVSGTGTIAGHVYEQDGFTGIAGATVTMSGTDEFGMPQNYTFTTNGQGAYSGSVYAGTYSGSASCGGYQNANAPVQGNPFDIAYDEQTAPIDYILDEEFVGPCEVIAEYYPDPEDPSSPYVKVYWGCYAPDEIVEPFETGDFSLFDWQIDASYPWSISTNSPYEGQYCMKSGGAGVASVNSNMSVTVDIPADGEMSFFVKTSCESSYDKCNFFIDGAQLGTYTGTAATWGEKTYPVTAGTHTFKWTYSKDGSVNSGEDCAYVDYITFYREVEPWLGGWHTYATGEFDNALGSSVGTSQWAYEYPVSGMDQFAGYTLTKVALFSDSQYGAVGGNYTCSVYVGGNLPEAGTLASSITVDVPANQNAWVEFPLTAPVAVTGNEAIWVVWTANTQVSSWPAGMAEGINPLGQWWNSNDGSGWGDNGYGEIWTMKQFFTDRSGREVEITPMANATNNNVVKAYVPAKGAPEQYPGTVAATANPVAKPFAAPAESNRAFSHYRVYRTDCFNDGPYTEENTVVLACELQDTVYIDVSWPNAAPGVYKWGVGTVYSGNRESEIAWSEPTVVPAQGEAEEATRAVVEIGNGTGTTYVTPFNSLWGYSFVEQIYTASEIGTAGMINSISFNLDPNYSAQTNSVDVFMKNVSRTSFASTSDYEPVTAADMVYTGTVTFNEGWSTITLNTPFHYDGTSNLMIALHEYTSGYSTRYFYNTPTSNNSVVSFHSDGADPNPYNIGSYTGSSYTSSSRSNIRLDISAGGGNGGNGAGQEPIQEPRESTIVWSNCIDKDMYLDNVTVNVLLNSADSPEGVNVALTNLNEAEQALYPVAPVTLDATGFYAWESFRRGEYAVSVTFNGYEPIYDTVNIWENTDLRYVMIEILQGITGNIYVSRTGWAMWDEVTPNPGPGPQPGEGDSWYYDFENSNMTGWTTIDADGDGYNWGIGTQLMTAPVGHNSNDCVFSQSYDNSFGVLYPDNYLVSQLSNIADGSVFSFWACGQDASYAAEHFGVAISTTGTNPSDFTTIYEHTIGAKGERYEGPRGMRDQSTWMQYTVDLSAYAGQACYIAIRHFNCSDMFYLDVDDIELSNGAKSGDRHLEYYKVMCTSIDNVPIYNHNTVHPFCQLDTNDPYQAPLVEGEHYLCKVACMYSTGLSEWSEPVEWVYEPCEHWGPVDFVELVDNNGGNHIHWAFENGFNPYGIDVPVPPVPGDDATIILTAGDVWGDGSGYQMLLDPTASLYGTVIPETGALSTNCTGNEGIYNQFGYKIPENADGNCSTQNMVMNNSVTITVPAGTYDWCITNPTPGDRIWIASANGNVGGRQNDYVFEAGLTYEFTVTLDNVSGNDATNVTISGGAKNMNAPLAAGEVKNIANVEVGDYGYMVRPLNANNSMVAFETGMMRNGVYAFNITDIANFDERVIFLHNLMSDSRFNVIDSEAEGMFLITATNDNMDLEEAINDFSFNNANQFAMMDKVQAAQLANVYKSNMDVNFVNSLMMDIYVASRENNLCELADPFCTDNGMYEFPAGVNAGSGETGPDYDCLYTTPNPAWYYMRIDNPGDMDIYMYSTPGVDIDFCCWGPFDDPTAPCPNGLTANKVVSCSYSAQPTEHCLIPASAQTGEYYIMVITNYSNQACNINFSKVSGVGTTDCGILPPVDIIGFLVTRDGEYLAFVGPNDRDYTDVDEYGEHVYCVRPIYPGEQELPDHNYGWSMGCPVCTNMGCAAPMHLEGTYEWRNGQYGALISWVTDSRDIVSYNIYRSNNGVNYEKIGSIDGNNTEYFDAVEIGTYYYQVTAISDCGESVPALTANGSNFVIVTVTSINENGGVTMYPNPTSGNVKIIANAMSHITVVNGLGQVVYDADVDCDEMSLNMAQFNAGIYTVRIATESGVSAQRLTVVR